MGSLLETQGKMVSGFDPIPYKVQLKGKKKSK